MNILVACEEWGRVRDAMIARGHNAVSCDLKPSRTLGPHYQGDARDILPYAWDMLIAHPTCRRLANSGVRWLHERPHYWQELEEGAAFFRLFDQATHIPLRCVENPVMHGYALERVGRSATQFVQPWWFGDPFQKTTGLWLTGLKPLVATHKRTDYTVPIVQECWRMAPGPEREALRGRTYQAVADAMAQQWG